MNVTREKIDELNTILKIKVEVSDYEERVGKILKDYRRKANVPGFRPGKVPTGMIKKMYGQAVLVEEVNKLISESISKYIVEEKLNLLGEPLPSKEQKTIDFDNQKEYEFAFDLGLAPEFEMSLTKKDKVTYYDILVDDARIDNTIANYAQRFGNIKSVDVVEDKEVIRGEIVQLNKNDEIIEDGIKVDEATISVESIKNEESKKNFIGANKNQIILFNPKLAFENETEIASLLKIEKEQVENLDSNFQITIKEITLFVPSEINQELFDKVYGLETVKSEEEFRAKIHDEIKDNLKYESDYKLLIDTKEKLVKKFKLNLPDEFLKRWLLATNKELKEDQIDSDYENFKIDLQWQIIKDKIINENDLKVTEEEILEQAMKFTTNQFQQYGLLNLESSHIENYAKEMLQKDEEKRKISDRLFEDKIIEYVKETLKIDKKKVTVDDFNKLFEQKTKKKL